MPPASKRDRYHHGDLRAALVDTAVELIGEHGVRGFSLAEASRRLGVTVSAPYRHFADRDALLAEVAERAGAALAQAVAAESAGARSPEGRLVGAARGYVSFAVRNPALFAALVGPGAEPGFSRASERGLQPIKDGFQSAALALSDGDPAAAETLAVAVVTAAHGHATMLHLGVFGTGPDSVPTVLHRAGAATRAIIAGRARLTDDHG